MTEGNTTIRAIGVIMDGNRRFARAKGLPAFEGHGAGYTKLKEFIGWAKEAGIPVVYAYAFSTENWSRTTEEVGYLVSILEREIIGRMKELEKEEIAFRFIGELTRFSPKLQKAMGELEERTKRFPHTLVVALSYGGRAEIVEAAKRLCESGEAPSEESFARHLWTAGLPDPDLIIRTSGEERTSNFLPWQSAYSEWFFVKTLWPAFSKEEFLSILSDFRKRERRNGK